MRLYTEEEVIKIMEQLEVKGFNDELSTHTEELRHMEDIGIINKPTEFAQQNTLMLESKVDEYKKLYEQGCEIITSMEGNEKALREKLRELNVMYDEGFIHVDSRHDAEKLQQLLSNY